MFFDEINFKRIANDDIFRLYILQYFDWITLLRCTEDNQRTIARRFPPCHFVFIRRVEQPRVVQDLWNQQKRAISLREKFASTSFSVVLLHIS